MDGFFGHTREDQDAPYSRIRIRPGYEWDEQDGSDWKWNTRLAWIRKLSEREAVRVFGFVRGDSDPRILRARGVGVGFRRPYLRDWLFLEFEPRYSRRKRLAEPDREGVFQFEIRVEAMIGDL